MKHMILILSFCEFVFLLFIINVIWSICLFLLFYFIIYCTLFISNFIFVARNLDLIFAPVLIGVRAFQRMFVFCLQFYGWGKGVIIHKSWFAHEILRNRVFVLQTTLKMDAITKYSFPYLSFVKDAHGDGRVVTLQFVIYDIRHAL